MEGFALDQTPSEAETEAVFGWLREFNDQQNGEFMGSLRSGAEQEFFVVARDTNGMVIGGLKGSLLIEWLKLDLMAVSPECRDRGVGRRLVEEAERTALSRWCLRS